MILPGSELYPQCPQLEAEDFVLTESIISSYVNLASAYRRCRESSDEFVKWLERTKSRLEKDNGN